MTPKECQKDDEIDRWSKSLDSKVGNVELSLAQFSTREQHDELNIRM